MDHEHISAEELSWRLLETIEPVGPKDGLTALQIALGSAIICSASSQLEAMKKVQCAVDHMMAMLDEYPNYKKCHWEHED